MAAFSRNEEVVEFECDFQGETENAVLIQIKGHEPSWIPLSTVEKMERSVTHRGPGKIQMQRWIAQKRGFIED